MEPEPELMKPEPEPEPEPEPDEPEPEPDEPEPEPEPEPELEPIRFDQNTVLLFGDGNAVRMEGDTRWYRSMRELAAASAAGGENLDRQQLLKNYALMALAARSGVLQWSVTLDHYISGDLGWFWCSGAIQLLAGLAEGRLALGLLSHDVMRINHPTVARFIPVWGGAHWLSRGLVHWLKCQAVQMAIGVPGLSKVVVIWVTRRWDDAKHLEVSMATLFLRSLPLLMLNCYIAISYGRLDPSRWSPADGLVRDGTNGFDPILVLTIANDILSTGIALNQCEVELRNSVFKIDRATFDEFLTPSSWWGVSRILAGAAHTAMIMFWVALLTCAFRIWAAFAVAGAFMSYQEFWLVATGATRVITTNDSVSACCRLIVNPLRRVRQCGTRRRAHVCVQAYSAFQLCMFFCPFVVIGVVVAVFYSWPALRLEHFDNNYRNDTLPLSGPGEPQHFDCRERTSGVYPAIIATVATAIFTPLSWVLDPFRGAEWCRRRTRSNELVHDDGASFELTAERLREKRRLRLADARSFDTSRNDETEKMIRSTWNSLNDDGSGELGIASVKQIVALISTRREFYAAGDRMIEEHGEETIHLDDFLVWWRTQNDTVATERDFLPVDTERSKTFWVGGFSPYDCDGRCGCCSSPQLLDAMDYIVDPAASVPAPLRKAIDPAMFGAAVIELNEVARRYTTPGMKYLIFWGAVFSGAGLASGLLLMCGSFGSSDQDFCLEVFDSSTSGVGLTETGRKWAHMVSLLVLVSGGVVALACILCIHCREPRIDTQMHRLCADYTARNPAAKWYFRSHESSGCFFHGSCGCRGRYKYITINATPSINSKIGRFLTVTMPQGMKPGQMVTIRNPGGAKPANHSVDCPCDRCVGVLRVSIPPGVEPGEEFQVQLPEVQLDRGRQTRTWPTNRP